MIHPTTKSYITLVARITLGVFFGVLIHCSQLKADPLPSWSDGSTKSAIIDFVDRVTSEDSPDFVPLEERIATFDNDGTLWCEKPYYFQLAFALDRVKTLVGANPAWRDKQPSKAISKHSRHSEWRGSSN